MTKARVRSQTARDGCYVSAMSEPTEDLAQQIVENLGHGQALVLAMRLVLLVGQAKTDEPGMLEAVQEAIAAIKRVGAIAGTFEIS
jgi:hypothetical protein